MTLDDHIREVVREEFVAMNEKQTELLNKLDRILRTVGQILNSQNWPPPVN